MADDHHVNGVQRPHAWVWWLGAAAALAAVAAAVFVAVAVRQPGEGGRRVVPTPTEADALARRACTLTRTLIAEVDANGSSTAVLDLAHQARSAADDAAFGSAQWVPLDG